MHLVQEGLECVARLGHGQHARPACEVDAVMEVINACKARVLRACCLIKSFATSSGQASMHTAAVSSLCCLAVVVLEDSSCLHACKQSDQSKQHASIVAPNQLGFKQNQAYTQALTVSLQPTLGQISMCTAQPEPVTARQAELVAARDRAWQPAHNQASYSVTPHNSAVKPAAASCAHRRR